MSANRNSYLFSRVAIWLSAGTVPSVTIAWSSFRVNELFYRTSPTKDEMISRRVSRVDKLQTIPIDQTMLERIRHAMAGFSSAIRRDADEYIQRDQAGSNWLFQPRQDGWFATFDGEPGDAHAFHRWLTNILILNQGDSYVREAPP